MIEDYKLQTTNQGPAEIIVKSVSIYITIISLFAHFHIKWHLKKKVKKDFKNILK